MNYNIYVQRGYNFTLYTTCSKENIAEKVQKLMQNGISANNIRILQENMINPVWTMK